MPNTNPQAVRISNEKFRPGADRFSQLHHLMSVFAAEAQAEDWISLFPADDELIEDGSATDGRTPITNNDVRAFMSIISTFLDYMNANDYANRNQVLKIAVNPERI